MGIRLSNLIKNERLVSNPSQCGHWWYVALAIAIIIVPSLIRPKVGKVTFNSVHQDRIAIKKPEFVFIGNSMLATRIDPEVLSDLAGAGRSHLIVEGGTRSVHWFLILKNQVIASGSPPRFVFIFFRDNALTMPLSRTTGKYRAIMERLSLAHEPEVENVLRVNGDWRYHLRSSLFFVYPMQAHRQYARNAIGQGAAILVMPDLVVGSVASRIGLASEENVRSTKIRYKAMKSKVNDLFHYTKLRISDVDEMSEDREAQRFGAVVDNSFLPAMIDLASKSGIKLVFVRIKPREATLGRVSESTALAQYLSELDQYVTSQGHIMEDMAQDSTITYDMYLDNGHILPEYKHTYTKFFFEHFREMFKPDTISFSNGEMNN
jgi:hypothetical protein